MLTSNDQQSPPRPLFSEATMPDFDSTTNERRRADTPRRLTILALAVALVLALLLPRPSAPSVAQEGGPAVDAPARSFAYLPWLARDANLPVPHRITFGFQFAMEDFPEQHADDLRLELPRGHRLGLRSVRARLRWDDVEPVDVEPEDFDWSDTDHRFAAYAGWGNDLVVQLIAYPRWATVYSCGYDLQPGMDDAWRQFVRATVERYGDAANVVAWEIGNEPDGRSELLLSDWDRVEGWGRGEPKGPYGGCWAGRAERYVHFLRLAYEEIKAVDPDALVTYGGLAYTDHGGNFDKGFLADFLEAGGAEWFDVINYHWFPNVPSHNPGTKHHEEQMATLAAHGAADKPVWITETTRLTRRGEPESEAWQIEYLTRQLPEMLTYPEIERVYFYGWTDFPDDVSDGFGPYQRGFVRNDHAPKAALALMPTMMDAVRGSPQRMLAGDQVVGWRFRAPREPVDTIIAWPADAGTGGASNPGAGGGEGGGASVSVRVPAPTGRTLEIERFPADAILAGTCCPHEHVVSERGRAYVGLGDGPSVFVRVPRR